MKLLASLIVAAVLAPQPANAFAQSQSPSAPPAGAPSSGAPPTYMIGSQDLLKITVFDEPDLTNSYRVDSDGFITFPYINRIAASGLKLVELQERIRAALAAGYIRNPQVRVEIGEYKSQSVYVSGEVRAPGKLTMTGAMTVLEALAAAGSPTSAASSELTIAHPKRSPTDQDAKPVRVNWKDLQLGKITDVVLQDGDIINVPKAETFLITGYIRNGGSYVLEPGTTVQQAIALAGGLSDRGSDRGVMVKRLVNGRLIEIDVKLEDRVQAGDVITVRQRFF